MGRWTEPFCGDLLTACFDRTTGLESIVDQANAMVCHISQCYCHHDSARAVSLGLRTAGRREVIDAAFHLFEVDAANKHRRKAHLIDYLAHIVDIASTGPVSNDVEKHDRAASKLQEDLQAEKGVEEYQRDREHKLSPDIKETVEQNCLLRDLLLVQVHLFVEFAIVGIHGAGPLVLLREIASVDS